MPIQLKATNPEPQYLTLAERLLLGGEAAVGAACRSRCFRQAMGLQGLEQEDFVESSGLTRERRRKLLALVLQQQDRLLVDPPESVSARGAEVLRRQLCQRAEKSTERAWTTMAHRQAVEKRYNDELEAIRARHEERAQAEVEKAQRIQARDAQLSARRRNRSASRGRWQQAVFSQAAKLESARKADLQAHHSVNDERARHCLDRMEQARNAKTQQLQQRFQKVMDTCELARRDEQAKCWQKADFLQQMMKRSSDHKEACRATYEQQVEQRHVCVREREHEVQRVMRMNEYMQKERARETEQDMAIFQECLHMQVNRDWHHPRASGDAALGVA